MPGAKPTAADLYGKGIFTTLALLKGEPIVWDKHWRRLANTAHSLGIDLSDHNEQGTHKALLGAIVNRGITDGRARLTFYDETPSRIWSTEGETKTSLSILVAERRPIPENFKLTVSAHRINTTSPLAGIKSCNYLEHLVAYEEATNRGFHEAIRLNERDEITSACMANLFWEKGGRLFTPSLKTGCLPGTTREFVMENLDCEEVERGIEDLRSADRIFLTSAGVGVVAVAEFDRRKFNTSPHPLRELVSWNF